MHSEGNPYIANNSTFDGMAKSGNVTVSCDENIGGPCAAISAEYNVPYLEFVAGDGWIL